MKILLGSHHFFPSTGGIETVTNLLGREFVERGHEVRVVTETAGDGTFPFHVVRQPGPFGLIREIQWCDLFLQNNISLRTLWPLLFIHRPVFVIHQTWITAADGRVRWEHRLKRFVLRYTTSFAISRAIADHVPRKTILIGNPYDDKTFTADPQVSRDNELIFVGRLVSDKGADLLLEALSLLNSKPKLTIAGDGPERASLEKQAAELGLRGQINFVGSQTSQQLAALFRRHELLVVPSKWSEPFGIVALEGIACGCVVVGSAAGGLPEAIGPCGVTVPNGNARALADAISQLLANPGARARLRQNTGAHLERFTPRRVAEACLEAMTSRSK
ncbi:MAG: glycosyltransferase family 4 protein [Chthoniobacterales bacterium]